MQPVSQGVTAFDLHRSRQQNDESLQTRATQNLGAELKTASNKGVTEEEKLTAGQGDQVDVSKTDPKAKAKAKSQSSVPQSSVSKQSDPSSKDEGTEPPATDPPSGETPSPVPDPPESKIQYTDSQKVFLERLEELDKQAKTLRDMWRKDYMDWIEDQLKAREDMENFRQGTMLMWNEVATSRWIQGTRHAEAIRGML